MQSSKTKTKKKSKKPCGKNKNIGNKRQVGNLIRTITVYSLSFMVVDIYWGYDLNFFLPSSTVELPASITIIV